MATLTSLALGIRGHEGEVQTVQFLLKNKFGYTNQKTNGIFDEQLDYNIRHFQKEHDLYVDGLVAGQTYNALFKLGYEEP